MQPVQVTDHVHLLGLQPVDPALQCADCLEQRIVGETGYLLWCGQMDGFPSDVHATMMPEGEQMS